MTSARLGIECAFTASRVHTGRDFRCHGRHGRTAEALSAPSTTLR
ncbi:hypothetical protein BZL30_3573 [Mycobacterium kansasii]|uniref:Uncharacterized protein n=1 Tax=Mycobacterium kansasii TaxID=1768 RepID=A0A1V3XAA6_MYCKA|nr:hypothetical protein BZL30_3573 [Mycobacterium kansasii]